MSAFYVYLAHPLSDYPAQYLANVATMCQESRRLMDRGYCTINPAADLLDGLMSDTPLTIAQYQERSLDLLRLLGFARRSALYVLETHHADGRRSAGVQREIEEAERLGIAVVYDPVRLDVLREGL